ncbi:MAG TPA: organomercurial lyase [Gemmatimonadaceae bacterium]|nr:organomercurial lyase [Gemmatimonadaceae bacterium]
MNRPGATELRVFVYDTIASRGRPPASTEIGAHFGITADDARGAIADARLGKTLHPDPATGEIAIAGPVAGTPTHYRVMANGVTWFANSAWDMLGVAAMFMTEVTIDARCADCGDPVKLFLDPVAFPAFRFPKGESGDPMLLHFQLPASKWQDDIAATCRAMTLFKSETHLAKWLQSRGASRGSVLSLEQAWRLAMAWYRDPRDPAWRPRSREEQQAVVESVGLRGAFWRF